jgi:hypothetical protein
VRFSIAGMETSGISMKSFPMGRGSSTMEVLYGLSDVVWYPIGAFIS